MDRILFNLAEHTDLGLRLVAAVGAKLGDIDSRHFPDGELYQRITTEVVGAEVIIFKP